MKRRLPRIFAGCAGAIAVLCLCFLAFGAWYNTTPQGKAAATGTTSYRVTQTAHALSHATEAAVPTNTKQPTDTPELTQTDTPNPTATSIQRLAPVIIATKTQTPTLKVAPTRTARPTLPPTKPATFTPIRPTWTPVIVIVPTSPPASGGGGCCKHCGPNSQPCGNSCISLRYTCRQPPGCACP